MNIITLIENQLGDKEGLQQEHGLSIYIEVDGKKVLFDTGQSGNFIDNADRLDVDLKDLDYVFISHGHFDHSGGFKRLIEEVSPNIELSVGKGFFNKKYSLRESGEYEYTGNPFEEDFLKENNIEVEYISQDMKNITENLMVFTNFNRSVEFENTNQTMYIKEDGKYKIDKFLDEISLGIKTDKGILIIVGCSHVGLVNIIDSIISRTGMNIYGVIGGTHLVKEDDEKINRVIEYLKEKDVELIGACHCTGIQGETMLQQQLEEQFIKNNTGDILEL